MLAVFGKSQVQKRNKTLFLIMSRSSCKSEFGMSGPVASFEKLVAEAYGVDRRILQARGRHHNEARDVAIYLSRRWTDEMLPPLAAHFGGVLAQAISSREQRVRRQLASDRRLAKRVRCIERKLTQK